MADTNQLAVLSRKAEDTSDSESSGSSSVFESSLPLLFGHQPFACGSSRTRPFTYQPPQDSLGRHQEPIVLQVSDPPAQLHTLQAHYVWVSSIYMADLIHAGEIDCFQKRVLELGAGAGLASTAAARYGSCQALVSSDWPDDQILKTLEENLQSNIPDRKIWKVTGHQWGLPTDELLLSLRSAAGVDQFARFDLVLLADVLWFSQSHEALLETVINILSPEPDATVYLTAGLHNGRRGSIEEFATQAQARGFCIQWIREVRCGLGEPRKWDIYQRPNSTEMAIDESGVVVFFSIRLTNSQGPPL